MRFLDSSGTDEPKHSKSPLLCTVEVRAIPLLAIGLLVALKDFVVVRVILLLFPAVTVGTPILEFASIRVLSRLLLIVPKLALLLALVFIDVRLASKILPIVGVLTLISQVIFVLLVERTPDRLVVKHKEICIFDHFVKHVHT